MTTESDTVRNMNKSEIKIFVVKRFLNFLKEEIDICILNLIRIKLNQTPTSSIPSINCAIKHEGINSCSKDFRR